VGTRDERDGDAVDAGDRMARGAHAPSGGQGTEEAEGGRGEHGTEGAQDVSPEGGVGVHDGLRSFSWRILFDSVRRPRRA